MPTAFPTVSAETLYTALHETIAEQVELEDPLSTFELIGVIEQIKAEIIAGIEEEDEEEGEEAE